MLGHEKHLRLMLRYLERDGLRHLRIGYGRGRDSGSDDRRHDLVDGDDAQIVQHRFADELVAGIHTRPQEGLSKNDIDPIAGDHETGCALDRVHTYRNGAVAGPQGGAEEFAVTGPDQRGRRHWLARGQRMPRHGANQFILRDSGGRGFGIWFGTHNRATGDLRRGYLDPGHVGGPQQRSGGNRLGGDQNGLGWNLPDRGRRRGRRLPEPQNRQQPPREQCEYAETQQDVPGYQRMCSADRP